MGKKTAIITITLALLMLLVGVAYSHDIWLSPERFVLMRGDTLIVHQLIGTELDTEDDLALLVTMTPRFELITPQGTVDLLSEIPNLRTLPVIQPVLKRKLDFDVVAGIEQVGVLEQ